MGDFVIRRDKGIDNPNATGDNGEQIRPNTRIVINVQPHLQSDNSRAVLPVPTVDWTSNPRGQFLPIHGIDFLIGVTSLLIKQTVELDELSSKIESENRYIVKVPNGEELFIASEVSSPTQRCLCGTGRAFLMHLHDNTRQEALQFKRRLAATSCCFPCRLQELQVITPPGDYVGRVVQHWTWIIPYFTVRDINDDVLFVIEGPAVMKRSALVSSQFRIMSGDSLREMGRIVHGWDREMVSFTTTLHMPDDATQPKHKALLLGATFLLPPTRQPKTNKEKKWYHEQYYHGKKDEENRKHGHGQNNWTSAESIENYIGKFLQNTMHGYGTYRWRILGPPDDNATYEGYFFCNRLHGYGMLSYGDGTCFRGLYFNDKRWGPGIETFTNTYANVGLWNGPQLIRLTWRPSETIVPNFCTDANKAKQLEPFRNKMIGKTSKPWELNPALDFLKQWGADPIIADEKWQLLYSRFNSDLQSVMCNMELFQHSYYHGKIDMLDEWKRENAYVGSNSSSIHENVEERIKHFYAWNNSQAIKDMMAYAYTQDYQQTKFTDIDVPKIVSGQRNSFKPAETHENDCRIFLMSSYLDYLERVVRLLNESNVHVDVSDNVGNTALMYATCNDNNEVIRFLIDAGCTVDYINDSCCTALGISLMRYACIQDETPVTSMVDVLMPGKNGGSDKSDVKFEEWAINRLVPAETTPTHRPSIKILRTRSFSSKALKSRSSFRVSRSKSNRITSEPSISSTEQLNVYQSVTNDYFARLQEINATAGSSKSNIKYLFDLNVNLIQLVEDKLRDIMMPADVKKESAKNAPTVSKVKLHTSMSKFGLTLTDATHGTAHLKEQATSRVHTTIQQLLDAGANPRLIQFPQPALVMGIIGKSTELIHDLVNYGADPNEVYPELKNYTPLAVAIARGLNQTNLNVIRALLVEGADPNVRLTKSPKEEKKNGDTKEIGPPLIFAAFFLPTSTGLDQKLHIELLIMLIEFGCDVHVLYNESSILELAMMSRPDLLDEIIKCPKLDLNKEINAQHQSMLVKFFSLSYFLSVDASRRPNMISNLILYGADPMMKCRDEDQEFKNIFVYAKKIFEESFKSPTKVPSPPPTNVGKKNAAIPSGSKFEGTNDLSIAFQYNEALKLMTNFARMLHIRWLQSKLIKELISIVDRYKHRHWPFVMKDHAHKKQCGQWLTPEKCFDTWRILNTTKKPKYNDIKVLRMTMCLIQYYNSGRLNRKIVYEEVEHIEESVRLLLKDRLQGSKEELDGLNIKDIYVTPELASEKDEKFNICYDCCLPLTATRIECKVCHLVYFCNDACKLTTASRNDHPCDKGAFAETTDTTPKHNAV